MEACPRPARMCELPPRHDLQFAAPDVIRAKPSESDQQIRRRIEGTLRACYGRRFRQLEGGSGARFHKPRGVQLTEVPEDSPMHSLPQRLKAAPPTAELQDPLDEGFQRV